VIDFIVGQPAVSGLGNMHPMQVRYQAALRPDVSQALYLKSPDFKAAASR
jgi:hypothetical protein